MEAQPGPKQFANLRAFNWGVPMQKIDYAKLLGFDAVSDKLSDGIDFQDETLGDKLGAKVGAPEADPIKVVETK
jgi:hypothetical protein